MRGDRAFCFTQTELEVLLELSGGPPCSFFRTGAEPDDEALTLAVASLFRRGCLVRKGERLFPFGPGEQFRLIRAAPRAVLLSARYPYPCTAVCYGGGETLWLAEPIRTSLGSQLRLREFDVSGLADWLLDAGILPAPLLSRSDAKELSDLTDTDETGPARLRLEIHSNDSGSLLGVCEFLDCPCISRVRFHTTGRSETEPYTAESFHSALERCFGKETL